MNSKVMNASFMAYRGGAGLLSGSVFGAIESFFRGTENGTRERNVLLNFETVYKSTYIVIEKNSVMFFPL